MSKGIVIGKFYPLTKGHEFLIEFAANFMLNMEGKLHVIPYSTYEENLYLNIKIKDDILKNALSKLRNVHLHKSSPLDFDMQQEPYFDEDQYFWNLWTSNITKKLGVKIEPDDIIFASELYGEKLAKHLKCRYVPVDIQRLNFNARATSFREDIINQWDMISDSAKKILSKRVTVVGPESSGKTEFCFEYAKGVLTNTVAPEYAREYLNIVGSELTTQKLEDIKLGTYAQAKFHMKHPSANIILQDTDLVTTYGWLKLYNPSLITNDFLYKLHETLADLYLLLVPNRPMVKDSQRYGGDVRETYVDYWEKILKEVNVDYKFLDDDFQYQRINHAKQIFREKSFAFW